MKRLLLILFAIISLHTCYAQVAETVPFVNGGITSILRYSNNLFISGSFTVIGTDSTYNGIAMMDAHTGAAQSWNPAPNGEVKCMVLQNGKLVVGGSFTTIAGQTRNGIAVFDAATGVLEPTSLSSYTWVYGLYASNDTVYILGTNGSGENITSFDLGTGLMTSWQSEYCYGVDFQCIAKSGNYIYIGGYYITTNSLTSAIYDVMRFDAVSGAIDTVFMANSFLNTSFSGNIVYQVLPYNGRIYIAGQFEFFNNNPADGFLALDSNGNLTSFDVFADSYENYALFAEGNYLWVGGNSDVYDGGTTYYAAQIDINTDRVTCWVKPNLDLDLTGAIYVQGDTVYLGGWGPTGFYPVGGDFEMSVGNVATGPVSVSLSASSTVLCPGSVDTFFATVTNNAPITTYEWYKNGIPFLVNSSAIYITDSLADGDSIRISATNNLCNESTAYSSYINVHILSQNNGPTTSASICYGNSYPFYGRNLTQSGTYRDTMTGLSGCDSITTLILTVNSTPSNIYQTICNGTNYNFNGRILTQSGTYYDTLAGSTSCGDSIVILTLTVNTYPISLYQEVHSCSGLDTLTLIGASNASQIQWQFNDTTIATATPYTPYSSGVTVAGSATGISGNSASLLNHPIDVYLDSFGYIFVSDEYNDRIQRFPPGSIAGTNGITIAGGNGQGNAANQLSSPIGIVTDKGDNLYVYDANNNRVQKFAGGIIGGYGSTIAGGNGQGGAADQLHSNFICLDDSGYLYIADGGNNRVQKFPPGSTSATNGTTIAGFVNPWGISLDSLGNFYTADGTAGYVLKFPTESNIDTPGVISSSYVLHIHGLRMDRSGNIYVTDGSLNRILRYPPGGNYSTSPTLTVAGNGVGNAANQLSSPYGLFIDNSENIFVADYNNNRIQEWYSTASFDTTYLPTTSGYYTAIATINGCLVSSDTISVTVNPSSQTSIAAYVCAGNSYSFNSRLLTQPGVYYDTFQTSLGCDSIVTLTLNLSPAINSRLYDTICPGSSYTFYGQILTQTNIYYDTLQTSSGCDSVVILNLSKYPISITNIHDTLVYGDTLYLNAQNYSQPGTYMDTLTSVHGCDSIVNLYLFVRRYDTICQGTSVNIANHTYTNGGTYIDTITNVYGGTGIMELFLTVNPTPSVSLSLIGNQCSMGHDTLTVNGSYSYPILWQENGIVIDTDNSIITVAGGNGNGSAANQLSTPTGLCLDRNGNIYIADTYNSRIQEWTPGSTSGITVGWPGGNGYGRNQLNYPTGVFVDTSGNVYVADFDNNAVKAWLPSTNALDYVTGDEFAIPGYQYNQLNGPAGVFLDDSGYVYVADFNNNRVQKWGTATGSDVTVAGIPWTTAGTASNELTNPRSIYVDSNRNIFVADMHNHRVQKWAPNASAGVTVAGDSSGIAGSSASLLNYPSAVFGDRSGNLYITDSYNNRVQMWSPGAAAGITVAGGNGSGNAVYQLSNPEGVWLDSAKNIYICDAGNNRVQKWRQTFSYVPTSPGIYTAIVTNTFGCNSTSNAINIQMDIYTNIYDTICSNSTFIFGGHNYTQSGSYSDTLTSVVSGCDSIIVLHLTVNPVSSVLLYDTICSNSSFLFGGHFYSQAGIYIDTMSGVYACDSIITLNLTVNPISSTDLYDTICSNSSFIFEGRNYTQSGSYSDTLTSVVSSCDSIIVLHLTVNPVSSVQLYDTICSNSSLVFGGHNYSHAGSYPDTLATIHGCDSIIILNLTVNPISHTNLYDTICSNSSFNFGVHSYSQTGVYVDTMSGVYGCDSIVTLDLFVNPAYSVNLYDTICSNASYTFGGHNYSQSGSYTDTLTTAHGCDSILILNLTVHPASYVSLYDTICSNSYFTFGGHNYSQTGIYADTVTGSYGCDRIGTLYLFVNPISSTHIYDTICANYEFSFGGHSYSLPGTYSDTLTGVLGCDSILTLHLAVNPTSSVNLYDTLITGDTLYTAGHAYTQSGIYYDTLNNIHGCDSMVTLYLYVATPATFSHLFDTICQGFSVVVGNHTYTVSGTYVDTLTGAYGGDSIVTLNLVIDQALLTNINDTISQGTSVTVGTNTYTQSGTYIDTLASAAGCDSIVALHLFVITGINELSFINAVTIYPNPTQGSFTMEIDAPSISTKEAQISVTDMMGQEVMSVPVTLHSGNNKELISLSEGTSAGIYVVQLTVDGQSLYYRLVLDK